MDINKLKLPDDWAKDYESPVTVQMVQIQKIAQQIEAQRENEITLKISEQIGVNVDKDELKRALAYDRDQYRRGYEDGWRARSEVIPKWVPVSEKLPDVSQRYLVYTKYDEVMTDFFMGDAFMQGEDIIAWMSLPEPYKEEGEKDDE